MTKEIRLSIVFLLISTLFSYQSYAKDNVAEQTNPGEQAIIEANKSIINIDTAELQKLLKNNPKIGLLHNEDDVIMEQGEVLHLKSLFGEDRAKVFPIGGHCGNMSHPDAARFMANFLMGKEVAK